MLLVFNRVFVLILVICCSMMTINSVKAAEFARWSREHKPIKVFIENNSQIPGFKSTYPQDVAKALSVWKSSSKGLLDFAIIKDKKQADIIVGWVPKLRKEDFSNQTKGHKYIWGVTKLGNPVKITLATKHPLNEKESLSDQNVYMISMHEIGHAVGLWWHTRSPNDIMYPEFLIPSTSSNGAKIINNQNRGTLSNRDIQNLQSLYNKNKVTILDKLARGSSIQISSENNSDIGAVETTGSAAASVASKSTKSNLNMVEVQAYLKKNPNDAVGYNNLGIVYMENGDLNNAVESFDKSISLDPSAPSTHLNLGLTYVKLKSYHLAIKEYQKYIELQPDAPNLEDVKKEIIRLKQLSLNSSI